MANCNLPLPCASAVVSGGGPAFSISNTGGDGLSGESHSLTSLNQVATGNGIYGYSDAGAGVFGYSDTGGVGVAGQADNGGDAVYGASFKGGSGIHGYSESHTGYGVYGENAFTAGVLGHSQNVGVGGTCNGTSGVAVAGFGAASNTGVHGSSGDGVGVSGRSDSGYGVVAGSGTGVALSAGSGGATCAEFWGGDVKISGGNLVADLDIQTLNLTVKNVGRFENILVATSLFSPLKFFRIDHPLDPANKYLLHACVESAERKNMYDGVVTLDANGEAFVEVADWFEALNGDIRYQLTALGAPAPNLHIAEELSHRRFRIAGGSDGIRVSWQITGVRRDALARYEPMSVEQDKPPRERGYYQNPEAHGQTRELGISQLHKSEAQAEDTGLRAVRAALTKLKAPTRPVRPDLPLAGRNA